jgi:hypothetical protein
MYKGRWKVGGLTMALKEMWDPQCSSREVEALMALAHIQMSCSWLSISCKVLTLCLCWSICWWILHKWYKNQVKSHYGKQKSRARCCKFWPGLQLVIGRQFFTGTWNLQIY